MCIVWNLWYFILWLWPLTRVRSGQLEGQGAIFVWIISWWYLRFSLPPIQLICCLGILYPLYLCHWSPTHPSDSTLVFLCSSVGATLEATLGGAPLMFLGVLASMDHVVIISSCYTGVPWIIISSLKCGLVSIDIQPPAGLLLVFCCFLRACCDWHWSLPCTDRHSYHFHPNPFISKDP